MLGIPGTHGFLRSNVRNVQNGIRHAAGKVNRAKDRFHAHRNDSKKDAPNQGAAQSNSASGSASATANVYRAAAQRETSDVPLVGTDPNQSGDRTGGATSPSSPSPSSSSNNLVGPLTNDAKIAISKYKTARKQQKILLNKLQELKKVPKESRSTNFNIQIIFLEKDLAQLEEKLPTLKDAKKTALTELSRARAQANNTPQNDQTAVANGISASLAGEFAANNPTPEEIDPQVAEELSKLGASQQQDEPILAIDTQPTGQPQNGSDEIQAAMLAIKGAQDEDTEVEIEKMANIESVVEEYGTLSESPLIADKTIPEELRKASKSVVLRQLEVNQAQNDLDTKTISGIPVTKPGQTAGLERILSKAKSALESAKELEALILKKTTAPDDFDDLADETNIDDSAAIAAQDPKDKKAMDASVSIKPVSSPLPRDIVELTRERIKETESRETLDDNDIFFDALDTLPSDPEDATTNVTEEVVSDEKIEGILDT